MIAAVAVSEEVRLLSENAIPWTVERFLRLPQDSHWYELHEGRVLISPGPSIEHQRVAKNLVLLFDAAASDQVDVLQEANLELGPDTLMRPDVLVARPSSGTAFLPQEVIMAIEVVSPSSKTHDRILKHWMYADSGIEWYLRVELDGPHAPEVLVYRLKSGVYIEHARAHAGQVLTLTEPVEVSFDPATLPQSRM